jgi:hypothetical protein
MRHLYVLLSLAALQYAGSAMAECLKPDVGGQLAQGRLMIAEKQDPTVLGERNYVLELNTAVCLDANSSVEAVERAQTIHVLPTDEYIRAAFQRLVGQTVIVRGRPFATFMTPYYAPIEMHVSDINRR